MIELSASGRTGMRVLVRAELGEQLGQLTLGRDVKGIHWAPLFHVRMTALVELDPLADAANRCRVRQFENAVQLIHTATINTGVHARQECGSMYVCAAQISASLICVHE